MADSTYNILECRIVMRANATEIYVLIDNPTDFMPIGGWRKRTYPVEVAALDALTKAMQAQEYLAGADWVDEAPDADTQWQQSEIKQLRNANMELSMKVAQLMMGVTERPQ